MKYSIIQEGRQQFKKTITMGDGEFNNVPKFFWVGIKKCSKVNLLRFFLGAPHSLWL